MIDDILIKLENLHDFIEECSESSEITLIEKDVILQSLRDIYLKARMIDVDFQSYDDEIGAVESSDDALEYGRKIVWFGSDDKAEKSDSTEELAKELTQDTPEQISVTEQEVEEQDVEEQEVIEEQEVVVFEEPQQEESTPQLRGFGVFEEDEIEEVVAELFDGDSDKYTLTLEKLEDYEDLNDALISVSTIFASKLNSKWVEKIANALNEKLNS
ncbi:MAG: hypothetical protein R3Y04_07290 [Rikenellaceae bacterium]